MGPHALLSRGLDLLAEYADVVEGRALSGTPPAFVEARGWGDYLGGLSDAELRQAELDSLSSLGMERGPGGPPPSLRAFAAEAREAARLEDLEKLGPCDQAAAQESAERGTPRVSARGPKVKERKSQQIEAFLVLVRQLGLQAARLVDVGSGMGHLSRVASAELQRRALGLDWNARLLQTAARLAEGTGAEYRTLDALEGPLPLLPGDLALGLHACGEVTDVALQASTEVGASVAFVSCCLQKVRSPERLPLSQLGSARRFVLPKEVLGLSNQLGRVQGVEVAQAVSLQAREARHALRLLLELRGIPTPPGEEMRGLNRRRPRQGLAILAREAFATRGLPPPTELELAHAGDLAQQEFGRMRRWSLPRSLLARPIECAVAHDRAAYLLEHGYCVRVVEAFSPDVSPRNLALLGRPGSRRA